MESQTNQVKQIYYNDFQLVFAKSNPRTGYILAPRGIGKTEGPYCFRMRNVVVKMPRSNNAIAVPSYQKFLKDLMPAIRKGLLLYGLREYDYEDPKKGGHYVVGLKPPKHWPSPMYPVKNYQAIISFCTGATYALFSQDSKTKNQGNSLVSMIGDEAKLLDHARIREDILKAMRGGADKWGHIPEFNSELYLSDKFITPKSYNWIIEKKKDIDMEEVRNFQKLCLIEHNLSPINLKKLDFIRKNISYFQEANGYENLPALGWQYFKRAYENSSALEFLVSHLNYDMKKIEGTFYLLLDEMKHGYYATSESYYDNLEYNASKIANANCLGDTDINTIYPLELSFDFGGKHNCCVVCQYDVPAGIFYLLKDFVVHGKLSDIVDDFHNYYLPLQKKLHLQLWCDVSGQYEVANNNLTFLDEIIDLLEKKGWRVDKKQKETNYVSHSIKYGVWEKVLDESPERDKRYPRFRFNRNNADRTIFSMGMAPQKNENGQIKKDKSSEKNPNIPYEKATHLSDAIDNPICFRFSELYSNNVISWDF
jgi:hypothetical protein